MKAYNSTFKAPTKPMKRSAWNKQPPKKRSAGLGQRVAEAVGTAFKHLRGESSLLRSEAHRKNVAALPCAKCGIEKLSQAAHPNAFKGMGLKACDSLVFPLCCTRPGITGCHADHDQGAIYTKQERAKAEWEFADATRAELIKQNKWPAEVEEAYQKAIAPLARLVHVDTQ